jgi:predicted acetyltransferase
MHLPPASEQWWDTVSGMYPPGRVFGAFQDGELVGTASSGRYSLAVPGGSTPAAGVTMVGVRPDRTRRGVLTAIMQAQLAGVHEPVAMLHASEAPIYGRFGYGPATRRRTVSVDTRGCAMRADAPQGGRVRLIGLDEAQKVLPEVYQRISTYRPGMISRDETWWRIRSAVAANGSGAVAVHTGPSGVDDGYVVYSAHGVDHRRQRYSATLEVGDLQAADAVAATDLWRFLLGVDLVDAVSARRPLDEPLEWWLTDRRHARVSSVDDELWVRLVDVPTALASRAYQGGRPVVIEVRDGMLPHNSGCYRIGPDGVSRCEQQPQLVMDVDALGALYLGDVRISTLAQANRVAVHDAAAVVAADQLFATDQAPWCGTGF